MIFLYILIAVLLVLFLITLMPLGIKAKFKNKVYCDLKIGFIKIRLLPEQPKKKKTEKKTIERKKKTENQKEKEISLKKLFKQNGVSGIINILKKIASLAAGALKDVFKHIIIRELIIDVVVGGDDAAETALSYGKICSVVYPAVSTITRICVCKSFNVLVSPDFKEGSKSYADCILKADIKIFWLVKAAIVHGFKALQVFLKFKKANTTVQINENNND